MQIRSQPSRFLQELPQDDLVWETGKKHQSVEQKQEKAKAGVANLREMLKQKPG